MNAKVNILKLRDMYEKLKTKRQHILVLGGIFFVMVFVPVLPVQILAELTFLGWIIGWTAHVLKEEKTASSDSRLLLKHLVTATLKSMVQQPEWEWQNTESADISLAKLESGEKTTVILPSDPQYDEADIRRNPDSSLSVVLHNKVLEWYTSTGKKQIDDLCFENSSHGRSKTLLTPQQFSDLPSSFDLKRLCAILWDDNYQAALSKDGITLSLSFEDSDCEVDENA